MAAVSEIKRRLFGPGIDSDHRLPVMLLELLDTPPDIFWPVFLDGWSSCDATWPYRRYLLKSLRAMTREKPAHGYFDATTAAFFDDLSDPVTIYRGGERFRVRNVSWTTDRSVAEGFAHGHRFIPVVYPVVAQAMVPKDAIFAIFIDRKEAEILIDPRRLAKLQIFELESQVPDHWCNLARAAKK